MKISNMNTSLESHDFEDTMGIMIDTGCKALDRKMNSHICFKGGGGTQTTTSSSGVPDWLKPDVQRAFGQATDQHKAGNLSKVEGFDEAQIQGLKEAQYAAAPLQRQAVDVAGRGLNQIQDAALGQGKYDPAQQQAARDRILANERGQQINAANAGGSNLNDARFRRAQAAGQLDKANQFQQQDLQRQLTASGQLGQQANAFQRTALAPSQTLQQTGETIQQQRQTEGDAAHQGLQRLFGYFGSGAAGKQSESTAPKAGGK